MEKLAYPKPSKKPRKSRRVVDPAHLAKVRDMACIVCKRAGPSEPHHPKGVEWGCGTSLKASDLTVIPLCHDCHHEYHQYGRETFERKHGTHRELLNKVEAMMGGV